MIAPEPTEGRLYYVEEYSLAYLPVEVPAAGRLGVIEEPCHYNHSTEQGASFYHPGGACKGCGAAV